MPIIGGKDGKINLSRKGSMKSGTIAMGCEEKHECRVSDSPTGTRMPSHIASGRVYS